MEDQLTDGVITEDFYNDLMDKDRITDQWIMISTPIPVLLIISSYVLFVLKLGPKMMSNRNPYEVTTLLRIYNVVQIIYNCYFMYDYYKWPNLTTTLINYTCSYEGHDKLEHYKKDALHYFWHFYMLKLLDLCDTIFIVLRKKDSHISFLHVFHHVSMAFGTWFCLKYIKPVQGIIPGMVNIFIHAIMYSYYLLSTFPSLSPYLSKWKKALTSLQMAQFVVILIYVIGLYMSGCPISKTFTYIAVFMVFLILVLFINFYIQNYVKRKPTKEEKIQ